LLALAAEPLYEAAASGARGTAMLSPAASALGARLLAGVPVADLLFAVEGGDLTSLSALGIEIDTVIGEVATARAVPLALVDDIARLPVIERVQAAGRMRLKNDLSVPDTGAPGVWSEYGATGEGMYDVSKDPLKFRTLAAESNRVPWTSKYNPGIADPSQSATDVERLIKEYGYEGMINPEMGMGIKYNPTEVRPFAKGGLSRSK